MNTTVSAMRALGDETRFRLARILARHGGELCICEIVDILRKPQYAVSRAARELARSGVVEERREGKLVYYRLSSQPFLARVAAALRDLDVEEEAFRHDLDRLRWRVELRSSGKCVVTSRPATRGRAELEGAEVGRAAAAGGSGGATPERRHVSRKGVLFVCVHNSARSQIAEELLRKHGGDLFEVESAGLKPGAINPLVAASLAEEGIDISGKSTKSVVDLYRQGRTFDFVITLCSRKAEESCPGFPGPVWRLSWPFPDPRRFDGGEAEVARRIGELKEAIRERILQFVAAERAGKAQS